jgi:hypothetical protein
MIVKLIYIILEFTIGYMSFDENKGKLMLNYKQVSINDYRNAVEKTERLKFVPLH